ncbi:MAG: hypothetical protein QG552_336 [Thermodesulfobacteriota bacterium]|nr:hypothetical protein [Thermodesulfobacteriota bacterium]
MENKILTEKQSLLIDHLPEEILSAFYLTGGTALSAFYLEHRLSDDLELFTETEETIPPVEFLTAFMKKLPDSEAIRYQRLFDRRIFAVVFKDGDTLKVEFTTYPFRSIEERIKFGKLTIDSLSNMITGKLFAITDRFDPKDFVDLYVAVHRYALKFDDLIMQTEQRFDIKGLNYVIPERLLMVKRMGPGDLPIMLSALNLNQLKTYFIEQSAALVKSRAML